ncbi:C45 family autoproteolytic acyltransferase/hydolase [Nitrincola iocasae]|nr:C45 family peptidase [Nitrincola iocasae]
MLNSDSTISWMHTSGTPEEIGYALGCYGRDAVHGPLQDTQLWKDITDKRHYVRVTQLMEATRQFFPQQWSELEGLAEGLDLPFEQVFAWNSRGDLLMDTADGCTSVMLPGPNITLAHNEDGLPCLKGYCFVAEVHPQDGIPFFAFCYPGSIPGHTFSHLQDGRTLTVNNLRLQGQGSDIPRMVLSRSLLSCATFPDMLDMLEKYPPCGGFHFSIVDAKTGRLVSVETGAGVTRKRQVSRPQVHANHALFHPSLTVQHITNSSHDRQLRGQALLALGIDDPLQILRDQCQDGLPVYREDKDDPDNENTLATVVFSFSKQAITWSIYSDRQGAPAFSSQTQYDTASINRGVASTFS